MKSEEIQGDFPEIHDFNKEKSLTGYYLGKEDNLPPHNTSLHKFQVSESKIEGIWDSAQLNRLLQKVELNMPVRISFKGTSPVKSNPDFNFKIFQVEKLSA
jgi:hypothetical protein